MTVALRVVESVAVLLRGLAGSSSSVEPPRMRPVLAPSRQAAKEDSMLPEDKAATAVVDASYLIHTTWGPGLLESAYAIALETELRKRGHRVAREVRVPVVWDDGP